jgi:putative hydrolase of HD superfamily
MEKIVATMEDSPAAEKIKGLWIEYELDKSEEAHFVHDLDKLELALQTLEYEHKFNVKLDGFMNTARAHLKDPQMRKILDCIISRRPSL